MSTKIKDELIRKKEELEANLQDAINIRNQMEGKMQSRYDTQREEWNMQCNLIEHQLHAVMKSLEEIESKINTNTDFVSLGMIVELSIDGNIPEKFLLMEKNGGLLSGEITSISTKSPIGNAILGKKIGEMVFTKINQREIEIKILNIQKT